MAEPPPPPSIPARILGSGARRVGAVAGATGIDRALEEAIADAVVRTVESPAFERALAEVFDGPVVERAVEQAMQSEAVERALTEAIDSEMIDRVWERLLASDEAQKLVERIAEAPEVRAAIAQQGVGLVSDLGRHVGEVARKVDDIVERVVRRITFARQRTQPTNRAGGATRLLALLVDAGILNFAVLATGAILSFLINAVFGEGTHREPPLVALGISLLGLPRGPLPGHVLALRGRDARHALHRPQPRGRRRRREAPGRPKIAEATALAAPVDLPAARDPAARGPAPRRPHRPAGSQGGDDGRLLRAQGARRALDGRGRGEEGLGREAGGQVRAGRSKEIRGASERRGAPTG